MRTLSRTEFIRSHHGSIQRMCAVFLRKASFVFTFVVAVGLSTNAEAQKKNPEKNSGRGSTAATPAKVKKSATKRRDATKKEPKDEASKTLQPDADEKPNAPRPGVERTGTERTSAEKPPEKKGKTLKSEQKALSSEPVVKAQATESKTKDGAKVFKFGEMEIEGRLKSPQIVYFLRRVRAEFSAGDLGHRPFVEELAESSRDVE